MAVGRLQPAHRDGTGRLEVIKDGALNPDIVHSQEIRGVDPIVYALGANLHRRHLSNKDKRDLIGNLLLALPEWSNRQIAALVGVSHHTIGSIRSDLERRGQMAHVETRTDTKGRKQPATKTPKTRTPEPPVNASPADTVTIKPNGKDVAGSASAEAGTSLVTSINDSLPTGTSVAGTFGRLSPIEVSNFLKAIPPTHHRMLKHALRQNHSSNKANAEIAKLARDSSALLAHASHNKDAIRKKLARIISITDSDKKLRGANTATCNAKLDNNAFSRAISLPHH
jgi:hypothetical protein